jgi:hypothetical protein
MGIANITNNILTDSGVTIGAANGVATLDAGGKIPVSQLPNSVMEFKGTWSAATNTPTLADGTGNAGDVYEVSAAGTVNFGAGGIAFAVGDYVVYDGATWQYSSGQKGTITSLTFSAPLTGGTITTSGTVGIPAATSTVNGYLSSTDWTTFNGKQAALTNPVTGTGTTNYIPKFTGASTLGNSIIYENATGIGIGTNGPLARLHVDSSAALTAIFDCSASDTYISWQNDTFSFGDIGSAASLATGGASNDFAIRARSTYNLIFATDATEKMRLTNGGKLGIGTPSVPTGRLLGVSGGAQFNGAALMEGANFSIIPAANGQDGVILNVGYDTGTDYGSLFINTGGNTSMTLTKNGAVTFAGSATATSFVKTGGTSAQFLMADGSVTTGGITGTLTTNYIPKATGAGTLGNSLIYDNGTTVSIGATGTSADEKFKVVGAIAYNGIARFENSLNQGDVNHGTIMVVNTKPHAIGNDASIGFALKASGESLDPRASIGAKTESSYGGALVFNTRSDAGTYTEKVRISATGNLLVGTQTATSGFLAKINGPILNYITPGGNDRNSIISSDGVQLDFVSYGLSPGQPYSDTIGIFKPAGSPNKDFLIMSGDANIRFVTGGYAERVRFWNNGNVSINSTTDAGYKLDVNGTGRFTDDVYFTKASPVLFYPRRIVMNSNGDFGINNNANSSTLFLLSSAGAATFSSSVVQKDYHQIYAGAGNITYANSWSGTDGGYAQWYNAGAIKVRLNSNGDSYFNGGNVGIGTATPSGKLDVDTGSTNVATYSFGLDNKYAATGSWARSNRIYNSNYTAGTSFFGVYGGASSVNHAYWTIGNPSSIDATGFNTTTGVFLFPSGNVGVATNTDSGYKLDVAGTGRFQSQLLVAYASTTEPFVNAIFRNTNSGGNDYGGILVNGLKQAHVRFLTGSTTWDGAGAKQWQIQAGNATNEDIIGFYSWTSGSHVINWGAGKEEYFYAEDNSTARAVRYYNYAANQLRFYAKNASGGNTAVSLMEYNGTSYNRVLTSGNYSSYALPLSGGTLSGGLTVNSSIQNYLAIGPDDNVRTGLVTYDTTAMAAGVGGQLVFGYKYTSAADYTEGAILKMYKENGTSGDYSSGMKFQVRNTGAGLSTKMTLDPSGRLGIGITPQYPLHVKAGSVVGSRFIVTGTYAPLQFSGDNSTTLGALNAYEGHIIIGRGTSTGSEADIAIQASTGKVSIGFPSPTYISHKLVNMNGAWRANITSGGNDRCEISDSNGSQIDLVSYVPGSQAYSGSIGMFVNGGKDMLLMAGNSNIRFVTGGYTENMRLWNGGNFALGNPTVDNGARLQVSGSSTFSGPIVQGGGASRSTYGVTIAYAGNSQTIWTANSDCGDGGRFFSIVNETSTTNAFSAISFRVNPASGGSSGNAMLDMKFVNNGSGASTLYWSFLSGGSWYDRMSLSSTGNLTAAAFFESSDATIKTLITDNYQSKGIESVVAKLYIKNGKEELGYYAQDVQDILPSAVSKGGDGLLSLSYREVHTAKIARLEKEVEELKSQLARL